jgi:hypothetical protein
MKADALHDPSGFGSSSFGTPDQPFVTKAVTTRTASTFEDLGKNAKTQQLEEKTVATTTTHDAKGQERVVTLTQEVKITSGDQVASSFFI